MNATRPTARLAPCATRATRATLSALSASAAWAMLLVACGADPAAAPEPSELIDCSRAAERIELTASAHLDPECVYTGGFDITASGVTLDCMGALVQGQPGNGRRGIEITAPEGEVLGRVTVRHCEVEGFLNSLRIQRAGFRSFAAGGEYLHPTHDILLEDNRFSRSHGVGVYVDAYVEDVHIERNLIAEAGSAGIYLETGSRRNVIEDNDLVDNGYRENGPGGQLVTVAGTDLWFWGVGREAIAVDGSYENVIRGNTFVGSSSGHIQLYKNCGEFPGSPRYFERRFPSDANLIEGNVFWGGRNGIWVGSRMAENTLPMECTDPAYVDEPLRRVVPDYAADNVLRDNSFFDVVYGIRVEDDGTVVEGNFFQGASPDRHAVIVGTPDRTEVLDHPVTDTVVRDNVSLIAGNPSPYRWIHGHEGTVFEDNLALGDEAAFCEGEPVPRQAFIFAIAIAPAGPGGTAPAETPDLTVPVLGELAPCAAPPPSD